MVGGEAVDCTAEVTFCMIVRRRALHADRASDGVWSTAGEIEFDRLRCRVPAPVATRREVLRRDFNLEKQN